MEVVEIGHQMNQAGLPKEFIAAAVSTAFEFEGVYDLLKMWAADSDPIERDEVVSDIQELIDDCSQQEKVEGVYVRFDDMDSIAKSVRAFKDNLRAVVDQKGGHQTSFGAHRHSTTLAFQVFQFRDDAATNHPPQDCAGIEPSIKCRFQRNGRGKGIMTKIPEKYRAWVEAKKRHQLSHAHVQMARELGMNPKKLGGPTITNKSIGKRHCLSSSKTVRIYA